ncbi:MAG: GNAT family N-acetyltransferase [Anaerolineales bacterium]
MIDINIITLSDNLHKIVNEINNASWDDANEMSPYDVESLSTYLERQDTLFVACHDVSSNPPTLLGIASARIEIKPYGKELWLYIDEIDVCSDQRLKGVGKAIMRKLIDIAREKGCEEVWLGAEAENSAANALYLSLKPEEVAQVVGYTFEINE